jgi:hypothetical protein
MQKHVCRQYGKYIIHSDQKLHKESNFIYDSINIIEFKILAARLDINVVCPWCKPLV